MKYPQLVSMPSAVSDWLEEQLEARGIDSVVYARYVLSLLHSEAVDVICPDDDFHLSHLKKEVRGSGGGRKHFRRSSEWWRLDGVDVEQLKRSAAIQCLISATDQNCEIESLVDELWQKLNEAEESEVIAPTQPLPSAVDIQKLSPQELAQQYYAAFPPLNRNSSNSPTTLISIIPKWISSPKKDNKHIGEKPNESDNMKARNVSTKQKCHYWGRNKRAAKSGQREPSWYYADLQESDTNTWPPASSKNKESTYVPQKIENQEWNSEDDTDLYEDLELNIRDLLDSPTPTSSERTVEMMNKANMKECGSKEFISCGTNITSSIWSNDAAIRQANFDNLFNSTVDSDNLDLFLNLKFSAISIDDKPKIPWSRSNFGSTNENQRRLFEYSSPSSSENQFNSLPVFNWDSSDKDLDNKLNEQWSDAASDEEFHLAASLMKLNHNKNESSFIECRPRAVRQPFFLFDNTFNKLNKQLTDLRSSCKRGETDIENDDLLPEGEKKFRPIPITKPENRPIGSEYVDGSTFVISSRLNRVNYKRSESGFMCLETEGGCKKYSEYKIGGTSPVNKEFVLRFSISQNDKACQTDLAGDDGDHEGGLMEEEDCCGVGIAVEETVKCTCPRDTDKATELDHDDDEEEENHCLLHQSNNNLMAEILWKYETKPCEKCNNNNLTWDNGEWTFDSDWNDKSLRNIWNGGEVCQACLGLNGGKPPPTEQNTQLREDISQDGEQLLSDLSSLQKNYMNELPAEELGCDFSDSAMPKEWKRRHSFIETQNETETAHRGSWSFASRLEEDCLIQMSALPTLRSVTL